MAKKTLVRDQDKFMLRLPDGMRDRIKAKAERAGMSMNEAIVWCLEQHFPAPTTVEEKLSELAEMVAILKGDDTYREVDQLTAQIHDAIVDICSGEAKAPPDFKKLVSERFERWEEMEAESAAEDAYSPFDDNNWPAGWSDDQKPLSDDPDSDVFDDDKKP